MSKFYSEIAKYYDDIFPTGNEQLIMMKELAGESPKEILDAACGSGGYSIRLCDAGYDLTSIDLSDTMIHNLRERDNRMDARVMNILDIEQLNKNFDLIFCIGNSLVHLDGNAEILQFLESCGKCLKPDGRLLLQIVNYDRVLDRNVKSLSTIKNEGAQLTFERYYSYLPDDHKIDFHTVLTVADQRLENHALLHPIRSAEMLDLLKRADFNDIELLGEFGREPFDPMNSFALVITARKK